MAANWPEIADELVYLVRERLVDVDDFVRFGAVCKPWRRAVSTVKREHPFAPLLMLAKADNDNLPTIDETDKGTRTFIIPFGGQGFDVEVPKAQGTRCWGSPYGWVVTFGLDLELHILNLLTGVQLPLPSQLHLQQLSIAALFSGWKPLDLIQALAQKFVVGWNPSSKGELIVMALFGIYSALAFTTCILPDNTNEASSSSSSFSSWRRVESSRFSVDAIFFLGRIFMIDESANLSVCDMNQTPLKAIQIATPSDITEIAPLIQFASQQQEIRYYLVQICGSLHLVFRFVEKSTASSSVNFYCQTICFHVYRFKFGENKWYYVPDLGEYASFVGNQTSFAISTTTYPDFSSNSIYFTDDSLAGFKSPYCDTGVFNYKERTIEEFDFTNHGAFSKLSRPIFFMPVI